MSDPLFEADDAATPLTMEEREALIPAYIALRAADGRDIGPLLAFVRS